MIIKITLHRCQRDKYRIFELKKIAWKITVAIFNMGPHQFRKTWKKSLNNFPGKFFFIKADIWKIFFSIFYFHSLKNNKPNGWSK